MSAEPEVHSTPSSKPEVSGIGTVTVDGELVYEPGMSWKDEKGSASTPGAASTSATTPITARPVDPQPGSPKPPSGWSSSEYANYPKRGAIWFGITLVVIGAFLLIDRSTAIFPELRMVFGNVSLWHYWPILVIIGGIAIAFSPDWSPSNPDRRGRLSPAHFFDGLSTAVIGLVLLGCSIGLVSWGVWLAALSYWPILLVVGGLSILSTALKTDWFRVLGSILFILTLVAVAASVWRGPLPLPAPFDALAEIGSYRGFFFWN